MAEAAQTLARQEVERPVRKSPARKAVIIKTSHRIEREIAGVLIYAIGLFLLLALCTYESTDPSWNSVGVLPNGTIANSAGLIGSYAADLLLQALGISSFGLPMGLFFIGTLLFTQRSLKSDALKTIGLLPMLFLLPILLSLTGETISIFGKAYSSGGFLGAVACRFLVRFLNRPGTVILTLGAFLAVFIAITGVSIPKFFKPLGKINVRKRIIRAAEWLAILFNMVEKFLSRRKKKKLAAVQAEPEETSGVLSRIAIADDAHEPTINYHMPANAGPQATPMAADGETTSSAVAGISIADETGEEPKIVNRVKEQSKNKVPKVQEVLDFNAIDREYELPPLDLLHMELEKPPPVDEWSLRMNSKILEKKLLDYGVEGRVVEIHPGPVITMYEFEPAPGVKAGKIVNLSDDLSLSMGGRSVRIVAPIPGKPVVGIEIPNQNRETVPLYEIVTHQSFLSEKGLSLALGKDIEGAPVVTNLARMPHLLIAGATGTGKSVAVNSMICSLLVKHTPDNVRLLMIDPKMVELSVYEGIPHLLLPVITDPKKAAVALRWAVGETERRLRLLGEAGTRNIDNFNKRVAANLGAEIPEEELPNEDVGAIDGDGLPKEEAPVVVNPILNRHGQLPYVVILIDELADLMMLAGKEVEEAITRLAQMARAVGIHLILATQRPSVDVITGLIKANFPARISFKVSSKIDSRTILDGMGAESLLGGGDMLFMRPDASALQRVHGSYVTESEVAKIVRSLKEQGNPNYEESILDHAPEEEISEDSEEEDEFYRQAVGIVMTSEQASVSYVQRRLRIGYNRAARIIEMMERRGVLGPSDGVKSREILLTKEDFDAGNF